MLLPLILTWTMHSLILCALALLAVRYVPGIRAQEWLLKGALVGAFLTTGVQAGLGGSSSVEVAAPPATATQGEWITLGPAKAPVESRPTVQLGAGPVKSLQPAPLVSLDPDSLRVERREPWGTALLVGWATIASLLIARLAWSQLRLKRALANRTPADDPRLLEFARQLVGGVRARQLRFTTCPGLDVPLALGLREVVLPERTEELDDGELEGLLAHELAHLSRRDPAWSLVAHVLERVFFPQFLLRSLRARMEANAELCSDAWAAKRMQDPADLARVLARVAGWIEESRPRPITAAAMATNRSALLNRVEAILVPGGEKRTGKFTAVALTLTMGAVAWAAPGAVLQDGEALKLELVHVEPVGQGARARFLYSHGKTETTKWDMLAASLSRCAPGATYALDFDSAVGAEQARELVDRLRTLRIDRPLVAGDHATAKAMRQYIVATAPARADVNTRAIRGRRVVEFTRNGRTGPITDLPATLPKDRLVILSMGPGTEPGDLQPIIRQLKDALAAGGGDLRLTYPPPPTYLRAIGYVEEPEEEPEPIESPAEARLRGLGYGDAGADAEDEPEALDAPRRGMLSELGYVEDDEDATEGLEALDAAALEALRGLGYAGDHEEIEVEEEEAEVVEAMDVETLEALRALGYLEEEVEETEEVFESEALDALRGLGYIGAEEEIEEAEEVEWSPLPNDPPVDRRGEAIDALRGLGYVGDAEEEPVPLAAPPAPTWRMQIDGKGNVSVGRRTLLLDADEAAGARDPYAGVRAWLERAALSSQHERRGGISVCKGTLVIEAQPNTRFVHVQRIMEMCAHVDVRISRIEFQAGEKRIPAHLPFDLPQPPAEVEEGAVMPESQIIEVTIRQTRRGVNYQVGSVSAMEPETIHNQVKKLIKEQARRSGQKPVVLDPRSGITFGTVTSMMERLKALGIKDVSFVGSHENASTDYPQQGRGR